MNLKQLLWQVKFEDVKNALIENYPNQENNIEGYKRVFNRLLQKPIKEPNEMVLDVEKVKDLFGEEYWDVSGIKPNSDDPEQHWALEYCLWEEWLGFEIQESQLENMSKEEYVAHCLWEMTFVGFDEQQIIETKEELNNIVNEIKAEYIGNEDDE